MYDLIIRDGIVVDGSGEPGFRADVAVKDGRIAEVGNVSDSAHEDLDAEGNVITPGFIDGHTHLDAQMHWDPLGTSSCWHGITTAVMGNCGFTLAPSTEEQRALVVRNLERAEDISGAAMEAGIKWCWSNFREYLDAIDTLPKGINYAAQIGHSALRTFVMGEDAFERSSNEEEFEKMASELHDALSAGAIGFTTSRNHGHRTSDDRPVASNVAEWKEVRNLIVETGKHKERMFGFAPPDNARFGPIEERRSFHDELLNIGASTGVTLTWGMLPLPEVTAEELPLLDRAASAGAKLIGQSHSRGISLLYSFQTNMPYDWIPEWKEVRTLPIAEQKRALQNADIRKRLVDSAVRAEFPEATSSDKPRPLDFSKLIVWKNPIPPHEIAQDLADKRGVHPIELLIDLSIEADFKQFFMLPGMNWSDEELLKSMRHPQCVMTFSDAGAHVTQQDCSLQTYLLAHWVRNRQEFTLEEAVRMITLAPAKAWGFHDRGLIREGMAADLNVFDPERIAPKMPELLNDLPTGASRLESRAEGILATIVAGEIFIRNNEHTGALPGRLLRR